jgi:hypothetical protein
MTATWQTCSGDKRHALFFICAGYHRPLGHPLCLQALTRVYKYHGRAVSALLVPSVAPASSSFLFLFLLPPSSSVAPPLLRRTPTFLGKAYQTADLRLSLVSISDLDQHCRHYGRVMLILVPVCSHHLRALLVATVDFIDSGSSFLEFW